MSCEARLAKMQTGRGKCTAGIVQGGCLGANCPVREILGVRNVGGECLDPLAALKVSMCSGYDL